MGKYDPLRVYLRRRDEKRIVMGFDEVERVIGAELPASAFKHRAWWCNNHSGVLVAPQAWLQAGYETDAVDFKRRLVRFRRAGT